MKNYRLISAIIIILGITAPFFAAVETMSSFKLVTAGVDYTEVEFSMPDFELTNIEIEGVEYQRLQHQHNSFIFAEGMPELPSFSALIAIPNTGTVEIESTEISSYDYMSNIRLFPSQGFDIDVSTERGFLKNTEFYSRNVNYPEEIVKITDPVVMRDLRLVSVTVYPISYNPHNSQLTIRNSISVRINYNRNAPGENEITNASPLFSRSFENLYVGSVVNYEQFRNPDRMYQERSILVVYHHSATISGIVEQYMGWKRDKGFEINGISTASLSSNTAIKNYIQNAYDTWENPPEYIVIIGGGNGSLAVPYWSGNGNSDHPYGLLSGNDDLPDAFVGRISVSDSNGLATYWNKLRNYEITPYMEETDWYDKAILVGDPSSSGYSTIITSKYIKEVMERHSPDYSFSEIYSSPFSSQMNSAINTGASLFSYRGYIGMSSWYPSDNNLYNGLKLSNALFITCSTLDFNGGREAEPFFRLGTPTTSKGAITVVGMTTSATKTAFNNALGGGIIHGIFVQNMRTMGEALVRGKQYLWEVYGNSHSSYPPLFSRWANLIGDPSMDIWVKQPKLMNVFYDTELPQNSNNITISVTDENNNPLQDAWVTIRQENDLVFATGYTDENGSITHFFSSDSSGQVRVTVTKPDYIPHRGNFNLSLAPIVSYVNHYSNDDIAAGKRINLALTVKNHTENEVFHTAGFLTTEAEGIRILSNESSFGDILSGETAVGNDDFIIRISDTIPDHYKPILTLNMSDGWGNNWQSKFTLDVNNANLIVSDFSFSDGNNGSLEPAEQSDLIVNLKNIGSLDLEQVSATIRSNANGLTIIDSTAFFGNISIGNTVPSSEHFTLSAAAFVIPGTTFKAELILTTPQGFSQTRQIFLPVGIVTVNDPFGPDNYGYRAYDSGDTEYLNSPEYNWMEIASTMGGNGVNTGLQSDHSNLQQVTTMDLPFSFKFYGIEYSEVSICANGWISFGVTEQATFRNWRLPGPLGPSSMVAAFWDNLSLSDGGVYTYYDQVNHLFIVQWQNAKNIVNSAQETFQIILYDPMHYYTITGDGEIKIQYKVFNNLNNTSGSPSGSWGNYCTVGISDHNCTDGLEYTFNNTYPVAARPITNESAILFTTGTVDLSDAFLEIDYFTFSDGNNNVPESGETLSINMHLTNIGSQDAHDVNTVIRSEDQYLTITDNSAYFGDIGSQETSMLNNAYTITIASNVPHEHRLALLMDIYYGDELFWTHHFSIIVNAPELTALSPIVYDPAPGGNNNGLIEPGEVLQLYVPITNSGGYPAQSVTLLDISSQSAGITITNISNTELGYLSPGESKYPVVSINVSPGIQLGTPLNFTFDLIADDYIFSGTFTESVGGIISVQLGSGTATNGSSEAAPINIWYRSLRSQTVYTAAELNAAGFNGGGSIMKLGYYITAPPLHSLPNFLIRMKHTTAANASSHDSGALTTVYSNINYTPAAGGWDMLTFSTPFVWNGVDNILVDTAFSITSDYNSSGQQRVYPSTNGFRYTRDDYSNQTNVTTISTLNFKPQVSIDMAVTSSSESNRPNDLRAEIDGIRVLLNWDQNNVLRQRESTTSRLRLQRSPNRNPDGYNIYRNGNIINTELVTDNEYADIPPSGSYDYFVTAVYGETESLPSNIVSISIVTEAAAPQIAPEAGIYYQQFLVAISTQTVDAEIYYTLDGTEPNQLSNHYQMPFEINSNTLVKARAFSNNYNPSPITEHQYFVLYAPQTPGLTLHPESILITWEAPFNPENNRRLTDSRNTNSNERFRNARNTRELIGFNLYRSFNSGDYHRINQNIITTLSYLDDDLIVGHYSYYVIAVYTQGESLPSETIAGELLNAVAEPLFTPEAGEYSNFVDITISSATDGAIIYYTLDLSNPDSESNLYENSPIRITTTTTVKAVATLAGWMDSEIVSAHYEIYSSVEDGLSKPLSTKLYNAYPNPFNPITTIKYSLKEDTENIELTIYNIKGQLIRNLLKDTPHKKGEFQIIWDGKNNNGKESASGIYYYRMTTSDYNSARKVILLK